MENRGETGMAYQDVEEAAEKPSDRIETLADLLDDETVIDIDSIVDQEPRHLDRLNPENAEQIIESGVQIVREERWRNLGYLDLEGKPLFDAYMKILDMPSSEPHAFHCATADSEDARILMEIVNERVEQPQTPEEKESLAFLNEYLSRRGVMSDILIETYQVDLLRRFAEKKGDGSYLEIGYSRFKELAPRAEMALLYFELANDDYMKRNPEAQEKIVRLKEALGMGREVFNGDYYNQVCRALSWVVCADFEEINIDKVREAIRVLDNASGR